MILPPAETFKGRRLFTPPSQVVHKNDRIDANRTSGVQPSCSALSSAQPSSPRSRRFFYCSPAPTFGPPNSSPTPASRTAPAVGPRGTATSRLPATPSPAPPPASFPAKASWTPAPSRCCPFPTPPTLSPAGPKPTTTTCSTCGFASPGTTPAATRSAPPTLISLSGPQRLIAFSARPPRPPQALSLQKPLSGRVETVHSPSSSTTSLSTSNSSRRQNHPRHPPRPPRP